jgi:hypothetical protein
LRALYAALDVEELFLIALVAAHRVVGTIGLSAIAR